MIPFAAPVDDILFSMVQVADATSLPGWDGELAEGIIRHFADFAEGVIAPLDEIGDRQGCRLEGGRVRMPDGFAPAFRQLVEMGWQGLTAPEQFGGMGQGGLVAAGISEIFSGACHSLQMVCNLVPGAVSTLLAFGSEAQQAEWVPRLSAGEVLSTMCLTEPGAGSDLSRIRTRAVQSGDGWRLDGEKIFISGGDQDMSDDILHLVLARTGAPEDGVKGLSLFLTSRSRAGATIGIVRIEEKLGLHASPTCQMAFSGTPAELVGKEGEGLKAMFKVMNHARLDVALQGVAHAARASAIAAAYAGERVQGRRSDGGSAVLADHADVRRMLDEQRTLALGARAMVHLTLVEQARGDAGPLVDFLTPVCKVFCTEAGIRAADLGIQILGGYGYLGEYRVAQTWRDARITSIYEGANGIHALALATRGLRADGGAGADSFDALICRLTAHPDVLRLRDRWRAMRAGLSAQTDPASHAHDFMTLTGALLFQSVWSRIAGVSEDGETSRLFDFVLSRRQSDGVMSAA
ncbi:acyl-CoA dehydrogenase family protein [Rhizobium sp. NRK18]|uniref:acyl-CoA dehydrogenase family protein n=1 Tax=Rhizobium sp. NRK18 TaxID=2964667 RepID=UPI0021C3EFB7|nr:acyl-CoA dehydrogenase family protein [Rhizobium sp. NRK18]MCQ2003283.1 acyl-CoA dehydrogenase family protein [Rhizobium sp. NRK18]